MKCIVPLCLILFIICSCNNSIAEYFTYHETEIAIFPKKYEKEYPYVSLGFTPTKQEIINAENAIKERLTFVKNYKEYNPNIYVHLDKYRRQYFGIIDSDGKKYLHIYFLWKDESDGNIWLNRINWVCDGGSYYWDIKYYIETDELTDLSVNGYA